MRVLLDTNVLLDVLLDREEHARAAAALFAHAEHRRYTGLVAAISVPTVHYVVEKARGAGVAVQGVDRLLRLFEVAPVGRPELAVEATVVLGFSDYEDGVVHAAAVSARADAIVTRNGDDFGAATVSVHTPAEMLAVLAASGL